MVQVRDASANIARAAGLDLGGAAAAGGGGATAHSADVNDAPEALFGPSTAGRKAN